MAEIDVLQSFIEIANQIQKDKKLEKLDRDQKISSLGVDSLVIMEVVGEIQDELDIAISDEDLTQVQTVGDLEKLILKELLSKNET